MNPYESLSEPSKLLVSTEVSFSNNSDFFDLKGCDYSYLSLLMLIIARKDLYFSKNSEHDIPEYNERFPKNGLCA